MVTKLIGRPLLFCLGILSVALGFIGIFLPLLPTTPFLILAAFLFGKSSPRLHSWLTSIPQFGDAIIDWEQHRMIRPKAKKKALLSIALVFSLSVIFGPSQISLKIMLIVIGFCVSLFIVTRPSAAQEETVAHEKRKDAS